MSPRFENGHALLIGVGADLPCTVRDAEGLQKILVDPNRCAFVEDHVTVLTGPKALGKNILGHLEDLAEVPTNSTVIVFFSGHGWEIAGKYYLIPYGYDRARLSETGLDAQLFAEKLDKIGRGRLLVLLDCCHAQGIGDEAVGRAKALPVSAIEQFSKGQGRVVIASSKRREISLAGKPYSAFTTALIEALCGSGTDDNDMYVRVADIAMYTAARVPKLTKDKQHPVLDFGAADNFIAAYYSGGEAEPKALPPVISAPEIEPHPGAWSSRVSVRGDQIITTAQHDAIVTITKN